MGLVSLNALPFADMIQRVAAPIVQVIGSSGHDGVLISTDRRDSFLGVLLQCCAAGASRRVRTLHTRQGSAGRSLSNAEGLIIGAPQLALAGRGHMRPQQTFSLDRYAASCGRVFAIALDAEAVAVRAWRGARATIVRDRPIFIAYSQGRRDVLSELSADDYVVKDILYWNMPEAAPLLAIAVPREQMQPEDGFAQPLIALPSVCTLGLEDQGAAALKTIFKPHDFEIETGFYHPETDDQGDTWIWTGPGSEARMVLPTPWLGCGALRVVFCASEIGDLDFDAVEVRINNKAVVKQVDGLSLRIPLCLGIDEFSGAHTMTIINRHMTQCTSGSGRWTGLCVKHVALEWF